ncbi:MAG: hypothetical protein AAFV53_23245 [Myxococcota bacterium]
MGAFTIGLLLVFLSIYMHNDRPIISQVILIVGGSGIGSSLTHSFGSILRVGSVVQITDMIEDLTSKSMLSKRDDDISRLRRLWHSYVLTRSEDGESVWKYRMLDFSQDLFSGRLFASVSSGTTDDENNAYSIEGFGIGSRMLTIHYAKESSEEPSISIYPMAGQTFRKHIIGLIYLQAWDGSNLLSATILSKSKLMVNGEDYSEGFLESKDLSDKITKIWLDKCSELGITEEIIKDSKEIIKDS